MNPTRKTKAEDLEAVAEGRVRQKQLSPDEQVEEKLSNLRAFIEHLARTDQGKADLAYRAELLGPCEPKPGESNREFYGRLRRWLDRDLKLATRLRTRA